MAEENVIRTIEEQAWIDRAADPIQRVVRGALDRAPALADALHGKWLGHPLHPAMVALPVGALTTGLIFDIIELAGGGRRYRRAADLATAIGLGSALAAALPGLADWSLTHGKAKRVGFIHGALNQIIAGIYVGSVVARRRGQRKLGIGLSITGYTLLIGSAWLGGELAYRFGVGVGREDAVRAVPRPEREAAREAAAEARP